MDVGEIGDRDSLAAWLKSLPQGTKIEQEETQRWAVLIAHRAAMRVLPGFWHWTMEQTARTRDLTVMPIYWANVTSGVAGTCPTPPVRAASASAAYSASTSSASSSAAAHAARAASSTFASSIAFASSSAASAASVADAALDTSSTASGWNALRIDCATLLVGRDPGGLPLWPEENPFAKIWLETRRITLTRSPGWDFWVEWYDKALNGDAQDWPLLTKIALIDRKDWDQGADHVNALIADIRVKHLAETRPLGEDAIDMGADGLWHRAGHSDIDRDILQDACDRVTDTVKRIRKSMKQGQGNALTALTDDLKRLDSVLRRYRDRPLRLHDTFLQVQRHIARDLASGELPDDHLVDDLSTDLGTAALDMRNACPKTAQVVAARASARFGALDERERNAIVQLAEAAASLSDEPLAAEFNEDAIDATNPALARQDAEPAQYRLTTRLAKIFTHDGPNLVEALILIGAIKTGVDAFSAVTFAILSLIL